MSRYTGPKCRLCRREGVALFLKGGRCKGAKCTLEKRPKPPGMRGWPRGRPSDYGVKLREKQKCKRYYGLSERQFRRYFAEATRSRGNTGETLMSLLERRLDNLITICGFAMSRSQARQLVRHGHLQVNSAKVDVPSYLVREGDVVRPVPKDKMLEMVRANRESAGHPEPGWLQINEADMTIRVARMPVREDATLPVEEELIIELSSR